MKRMYMILSFLAGLVSGAFCMAVWMAAPVRSHSVGGEALILPMMALLVALGYSFRHLVETARPRSWLEELEELDILDDDGEALIPASDTGLYEAGYTEGYEVGYEDAMASLSHTHPIKVRAPKYRHRRAPIAGK